MSSFAGFILYIYSKMIVNECSWTKLTGHFNGVCKLKSSGDCYTCSCFLSSGRASVDEPLPLLPGPGLVPVPRSRRQVNPRPRRDAALQEVIVRRDKSDGEPSEGLASVPHHPH